MVKVKVEIRGHIRHYPGRRRGKRIPAYCYWKEVKESKK